ncbi:MAG: hypothetical protein ACYDA8_02135, partial [Deferrisomatales bacterium]
AAALTSVQINGKEANKGHVVCSGQTYVFELYMDNPGTNITGLYVEEAYPDGHVETYYTTLDNDLVWFALEVSPTPPFGSYTETLRLKSLDGESIYSFPLEIASCPTKSLHGQLSSQSIHRWAIFYDELVLPLNREYSQ